MLPLHGAPRHTVRYATALDGGHTHTHTSLTVHGADGCTRTELSSDTSMHMADRCAASEHTCGASRLTHGRPESAGLPHVRRGEAGRGFPSMGGEDLGSIVEVARPVLPMSMNGNEAHAGRSHRSSRPAQIVPAYRARTSLPWVSSMAQEQQAAGKRFQGSTAKSSKSQSTRSCCSEGRW